MSAAKEPVELDFSKAKKCSGMVFLQESESGNLIFLLREDEQVEAYTVVDVGDIRGLISSLVQAVAMSEARPTVLH